MSCSTCNKGRSATRFRWMTDWSGASEEQIVADAGWRACTVCYPSAPQGDPGSRPTRMYSEDELAAERSRDERAAAKEARRAAAVAKGLTPDGSPFRVEWIETNRGGWQPVDGGEPGQREYVYRDRTVSETFKTERAATSWYVAEKAWGTGRGREVELAPAFEAIEQALAAKHGVPVEDVRAGLAAKVTAKRRRDGLG